MTEYNHTPPEHQHDRCTARIFRLEATLEDIRAMTEPVQTRPWLALDTIRELLRRIDTVLIDPDMKRPAAGREGE